MDKEAKFGNVNRSYYPTESNSGDGYVNTSYEDDYRNSGNERVVEQTLLAVPTGKSYLVFDTSLAAGRTVIILSPKATVSDGVVYFKVYEGGDYAGTTELTSYNPNRLSDFVHKSTIKSGGTGTTLGTELYSFSSGGESNPSQEAAGSSEASKPIITDSSNNYVLEIDNDSGGAIRVDLSFAWFEI